MGELPSESLSPVFESIRRGEEGARDRLYALVYDELHRMAHRRMRQERPGRTLQTTALVNEAFLRLVDRDDKGGWENRRHFFGAAAIAMKRILVDEARRRKAARRGGDRQRVSFSEQTPDLGPSVDLIALDEALALLASERPRLSEVVHHRFFLGLTVEETAGLLGVSGRTVDADWQLAKSWLRREMNKGSPQGGGPPDGR